MADATTVANLQADLSLNTENFSGGVDRAAGATNGLTSAILKADLVKGALNGVASFAKSVAGVVKQAVESYGEYEQLIGGVQTLFGASGMDITEYAQSVGKGVSEIHDEYAQLREAENLVISNAQNAWSTAGMGANEYMNMVTGFAASLKQSTSDSTEAAKVADMAMQDISDNANKMGTDMGSIQQAYQGFAKQNYTMLDNLKLGYGGTKTEMQRLLKDAQKISGVKYDINNLSDVYKAIHVIQKELKITGTTADEASTTIQGSAKAMKAAWSNMLTSMVTGGKYFDQSLDALVESVGTFVKNLAPAVQGALKGVSALIAGVAPIIADLLPGLVQDILPGLIDAASSVFDGVLEALPGLLTALENVAPMVSAALVNFVPKLIEFILEGIPSVISAGVTLLTSLVSGFADNIETIVPQLTQAMVDMVARLVQIIQGDGANFANAALTLLQNLGDALVKAVPYILTQLTQLIQDISTNISDAAEGESFVTTAVSILTGIADSLMESLPTVLPQLTEAVVTLIGQMADIASTNTTELINAAVSILNTLATGLSGSIETIIPQLTQAVMDIIDAIVDIIINFDKSTFLDACVSIVTSLANGITASVEKITERLPELITKIVEWLTNPDNLTGMLDAALSIFGALVTNVPAILLALTEGLIGIIDGIVNFFKEHGDDIMEGLKTGISDAFSKFAANISSWWEESGKPTFDAIGDRIREFFLQFEWAQALADFAGKIGSTVSTFWEDKIKPGFTEIGTKIGEFFGSLDLLESLSNLATSIANSVKSFWETHVKGAFTGSDGLAGKIGSWIGEIDLLGAAQNLVDKIKTGISSAWDSFKEWFKGLFKGLFDSIEIPDWMNPKKWFGGGKKEEKGQTTETGPEGETVEMPEGMKLLDYDNLQPISDDVIESYGALRDALVEINTAVESLNELIVSEAFQELTKTPPDGSVTDAWATFASAVSQTYDGFSGLRNMLAIGEEEAAASGKLENFSDMFTPISDDTIKSYQALATALNDIYAALNGEPQEAGTEGTENATANGLGTNTGLAGQDKDPGIGTAPGTAPGTEGAGEGEGGVVGLIGAFSLLPAKMDEILKKAQELSEYFTGSFLDAILTLQNALCIISTDEEGNTDASGGNTLYNSLGAINSVLGNIYDVSVRITNHWMSTFIEAANKLMEAVGVARRAAAKAEASARNAEAAYLAWADAIWAVIAALSALGDAGGSAEDVPGGPQKGGGRVKGDDSSSSFSNARSTRNRNQTRASGGPVRRGVEYLVGEEGPELFTPRQSGYIIPNEDLRGSSRDDRPEIHVEINGNIYGEKYLKDYVVDMLTGTIRKELRMAA